jgi:hypothetical protein
MKIQAKLFTQRLTTLLKWFVFFIFPSVALANPVVQYWQNHSIANEGLILEPRISFYSTSTNFNSNSKPVTLANAAKLNRTYLDLAATYALQNEWSLFGRASLLSTSSTTGFSDQLIGVNRRLIDDPNGFQLNGQLEAILPAYQNSVSKNDLFMGDQSVDVTFGAFATHSVLDDYKIEAAVGYTYRTQKFSAAIPYSVLFKKIARAKAAFFSIGTRGQFSLQSDAHSASSAATNQLKGAAGSYLINAVNPSFMIVQAEVGYQTAKGTEFYALLAAPLIEKNAASGIQASIGVRFQFEKEADDSNESHLRIEPTTRYDRDAEVSSTNDQLYLAKLNQGIDDGIVKGQLFDIFEVSADSETQSKSQNRVARARVTHVKNNEAVLSVVEYYRDQWIEKGFIAKRVVQ